MKGQTLKFIICAAILLVGVVSPIVGLAVYVNTYQWLIPIFVPVLIASLFALVGTIVEFIPQDWYDFKSIRMGFEYERLSRKQKFYRDAANSCPDNEERKIWEAKSEAVMVEKLKKGAEFERYVHFKAYGSPNDEIFQ